MKYEILIDHLMDFKKEDALRDARTMVMKAKMMTI
jgi:hypothetical protein